MVLRKLRTLARTCVESYTSIKYILSTAGPVLPGASGSAWICLLRFFRSCTWVVSYMVVTQRLRTYGKFPCRADLVFLEYRCPEEHFEGDQLSVMLFTGFY